MNNKITLFRIIKIYFQCKHCKYNAGCTAKYSPYRMIPVLPTEYYFWYSRCTKEMDKHRKTMAKREKAHIKSIETQKVLKKNKVHEPKQADENG